MKKLNTTCIFLLLLILFSCRGYEKKELKLRFQESILFQTEMPCREKFSGTFPSKEHGQVFYFSNVTTEYSIKFYDIEGEFIKETKLDTIKRINQNIEDIDIISFDSIYIVSQYTNLLYLLGSNGEIKNTKYLNSIDNRFKRTEFYGSTHGKLVNQNSIYLSIEWLADKKYAKRPIDKKFFQHLTLNKFEKPTIFKFKIVEDKLNLSDSLSIYNKLFNDSLLFFGELSSYTYLNNHLFYWSIYSDNILKVNPNNLSEFFKYKIASQYSTLQMTPLKITENFSQNSGTYINNSLKSSGQISRLSFNKKTQHYYLIALTKISLEYYNEMQYRPFVLLIYDTDFNKIGEKLFESNIYQTFLIPYKNGFLLNKTDNPENYNSSAMKFDYYEY
jgi:hypothetical protein